MGKSFKKMFCGIFSVFLLGSILPSQADAYRIGDKTGNILSTDIVTYVEGIQVPSYNIKGRTAVVAQDLARLGGALNFGVYFDEESRVLSLYDTDFLGWGDAEAIEYTKEITNKPIGTPCGAVLFTDIKTVYNNVELESFNIDGYTCIYADDFGKLCGAYMWDETARRVDVQRNTPVVSKVSKTASGRNFDAVEQVVTREETLRRWGMPKTSHVVKNNDGTYTAIDVAENINLETYGADFSHKGSFAIAKELPLFGAFFAGEDYNYIVFGQENLLDDNSREVIRIAVYDKNFAKLREIPVANCKTAIPFDASGCEIYENGNFIVVHTSRSQYLDENNLRPQTQLTIIVDKTTWKVTNMLGKFQYNHTSHALQEFVRIDGDKIITANYSDAAPIRGAFLQELDFSGKVLSTRGLFNVSGDLAANCTGAMIGGLEISDTGYLVPISSIDQSLPTAFTNTTIEGIENQHRDVYVMWTDKSGGELRHTLLSNYSGTNFTASTPYIVKLSNGNFIVMWQRFSDNSEESNVVCYAFVDGSGNQIGETYTVTAMLSDSCTPIESDNNVVWYVNTPTGRDFYALDISPDSVEEDVPAEEETPEENPADAPEEEENSDEVPDEQVPDSDDAVEIEKPKEDIKLEVDGI